MFADQIAPPGVVAKLLTSEAEDRVELDRQPTRFVTPILENGFTWLKQFLGEGRGEAVESGVEDDGVAAGAGPCRAGGSRSAG
jgi:hypothetical protein